MDDQLRMRVTYIEETLAKVIRELKQNKCLCQELEFLTEAEQAEKLEAFIDDFIADFIDSLQ